MCAFISYWCTLKGSTLILYQPIFTQLARKEKRFTIIQMLNEKMLLISLLPASLFKLSAKQNMFTPLNKSAKDLNSNFNVLPNVIGKRDFDWAQSSIQIWSYPYTLRCKCYGSYKAQRECVRHEMRENSIFVSRTMMSS